MRGMKLSSASPSGASSLDDRPIMRLSLIAIIAILWACASPGRRAAPASNIEPVPVEPRQLITRHLTDYTEVQRTLSRNATGDTTERESVRTTVEERLLSLPAGDRGVMRISAGHYSGGDFVDTLLMRRDDLTPLSERIRYPQRRWAKDIEFAGVSLHQINRLGDSTQTLERRFSRPVFAFTEVDLVVRSLPYRPGYHAILPLYSEGDDSLEMDTVAVTGIAGRAWTLRFADPAIVATYAIDSMTRRIIEYDVVNRRSGARARRIP